MEAAAQQVIGWLGPNHENSTALKAEAALQISMVVRRRYGTGKGMCANMLSTIMSLITLRNMGKKALTQEQNFIIS